MSKYVENMFKGQEWVYPIPSDTLGDVSITFNNLTIEESKAISSYKGYFFSLYDLDQWLRNEVKYNDELPENVNNAYDIVRDKIRETMNEYNCSLDDLD